jgi:hypothetical protein
MRSEPQISPFDYYNAGRRCGFLVRVVRAGRIYQRSVSVHPGRSEREARREARRWRDELLARLPERKRGGGTRSPADLGTVRLRTRIQWSRDGSTWWVSNYWEARVCYRGRVGSHSYSCARWGDADARERAERAIGQLRREAARRRS